jgi:hypothetical protein
MNDHLKVSATSSRSVAFYREWRGTRPYVIATTHTEDPEAPVELVRPFPDGSGDEVLVSLTREEWSLMIGFIGDVTKEAK